MLVRAMTANVATTTLTVTEAAASYGMTLGGEHRLLGVAAGDTLKVRYLALLPPRSLYSATASLPSPP